MNRLVPLGPASLASLALMVPEAAAEQRLGLTRTERRAVLGNLTTLGHDTRGLGQ